MSLSRREILAGATKMGAGAVLVGLAGCESKVATQPVQTITLAATDLGDAVSVIGGIMSVLNDTSYASLIAPVSGIVTSALAQATSVIASIKADVGGLVPVTTVSGALTDLQTALTDIESYIPASMSPYLAAASLLVTGLQTAWTVLAPAPTVTVPGANPDKDAARALLRKLPVPAAVASVAR